jgi:hypothetical protein
MLKSGILSGEKWYILLDALQLHRKRCNSI